MRFEHQPVTTFKIYDGLFATGPEVFTPPIYLGAISRIGKFSISVVNGRGGTLMIKDYRGPEANRLTGMGSTIYYQYGTAYAQSDTVYRKCISNVATIRTLNPSSALVGQFMDVRDMGDSSYNGLHKVTSTPSSYIFTYALDHADEAQTDDAAGEVGRVQIYNGDFSSLIKPMPWVKFGIAVPFGSFFPLRVYIHIH